MTKQHKERVQVGGNLAAIGRIRATEPVEPTDPALSFIPPMASVAELSPAGIPEAAGSSQAAPDYALRSQPEPEMRKPASPQRAIESLPLPPRLPKSTEHAPARVNKAVSPEYTRVALRLHNDVLTRLFTIALSQNKRYTALIEDYIITGLERHKG